MKKNLLYGFLFAMVATGCYQEELSVTPQADCEGRYFTASFEEAQTRTYVEDGVLLRWTAGDQISLFDGNTLNRQYKFDGETGDNSGTFSIVSAPYGSGNDLTANYAVYPYASGVKINENGVITAILPAEQTYAENSFGPGANTMVAVTKDKTDTFLRFKNICGYLKLQLYGENVTVKSITLTGNNNEKIAGAAAITPSYSGAPTVSIAEDATGTITMNCDEGVKIGTSAETATAFWIAVPPTTFDEGFEVTITGTDGGTFTKSTSKKISIERNVIKPMTAFEVEIETIPNNQIWYTSSDGKVVAPYKSKGFDANIESNVYMDGKGIIIFDGNITKIYASAFEDCATLVNIKVPNNVSYIGSEAFSGCSSLVAIDIPHISTIYEYTFSQCTALASVVIPDTVTKIEDSAFCNCKNLKNITLPNSLITIGGFMGCEFSEITIPESVKIIGPHAFHNCKNLSEISIPDGVITIGNSSFYGCIGLKTLIIPNNVTIIEDQAFCDCSGLTSIIIGDNVRNIGFNAFRECTGVSTLTLPKCIETIGNSAFGNMQLTSVTCLANYPPSTGDPFWSGENNEKIDVLYVPSGAKDNYSSNSNWNNYFKSIIELNN